MGAVHGPETPGIRPAGLSLTPSTSWEELTRRASPHVARGLPLQNFSLDWCKQPDVGLPKPDLVVFLHLQLAEAAARGEFGHERYENRPFQERALQRFQQLMGDPSLNWQVRACTP